MMQKITKQVGLFTLLGVLSTIVGYSFMLYKSYLLYNEIDQLDNLKKEKVAELKDLEEKIVHITSTSKDSNTVKQGEKLVKELGIPVGAYFKVTSANGNSLENADKFEKQGYDFLLNKDVDGAIEAFVKSENSYNGYHQVYEIARYLIKNKGNLSDRNSENWKVAYQVILAQYSWRMPANYKVEIQEKIK
jgi:hypothetical protein